jgi:hypothetical protein
LDKVEAYQRAQPNKGQMLEEMYKAGITLADVDRVMLCLNNFAERHKSFKDSPEEALFLKIWKFLSNR